MSNAAILEKAIKKALDNGWRYVGYPENGWGVGTGQWYTSNYHLAIIHHKTGDSLIHKNEIIYNHDFAKALWGEEEQGIGNGWETIATEPIWKYHLKEMVIAPDPIQYLGDHL